MVIDIKKHLKLMLIMFIVSLMLCYLGGYFDAILGNFDKLENAHFQFTVFFFTPSTEFDYVIMCLMVVISFMGVANAIYYLSCFIKSRKQSLKFITKVIAFVFITLILMLGIVGLIPAFIADIYYLKKFRRDNFIINSLRMGSQL